MIREDSDEAILELSHEELGVLNMILDTVKGCVEIVGLDEWAGTEEDQGHILKSIAAKVDEEIEFDPEHAEDWGSVGPPT